MAASTRDREAALAFLLSRIDYERAATIPYSHASMRLDRMRSLLEKLGNPQSQLRIVHLAGTKGKGSTAAILSAIFTASGKKTGLFSSPHLEHVEERIRVNSEPCSGEEFATLIAVIRPLVETMDAEATAREPGTMGPTYFEILTAMALLHFARVGCNVAVLEVGLGGRLDSTNACQSEIAVITSISFDHMQQLGNTLEEIAAEKAGIIKLGVPVVSGVIQTEPRDVIRRVAAERNAKLFELNEDFSYQYHPPTHLEAESMPGMIDWQWANPNRAETNLPLGLVGPHQGANAAVALSTIEVLNSRGWNITLEAVAQGLANVRWPARVEIVQRSPTVVIDSAHNVASVEALSHTLTESFTAQRKILIFATTRDKDIRGMLRAILPNFDQVIFTQYQNNPRGVPPDELDELAGDVSGSGRFVCPTPQLAWQQVRSMARPGDLIVVTGSFFIAAELRSISRQNPLQFGPTMGPRK
jgi:dihydrofolate synthase/folylpolyglutamate synthase